MGVEPSFSLYRLSAESLGNRFIGFPLNSSDFNLDFESFLKRLKRERPNLVFIANPNAPTGNLFPREGLLEIIKRSQCLVVLDEAYCQFSKATLLPELKRYPNLILLRTFSKGFGLGGARVGFMVAHEEVVEEVGKILPPYVVSPLNEEVALIALEHRSHFQFLVEEVLKERERVFAAMVQIDHVVSFSSDANFILFRVKDNKRCFKHLLKKGVLVRDVSDQPKLSGCLRVTVGKPRENNAFLRALKSYR
jgi:histidinol-phosphate aminotransferase